MATNESGFTFRGVKAGSVTVNPAKALPATTTGTLFTVAGTIVVTGLCGVVSTALGATATHISLGVTGNNTALAAATTGSVASAALGNTFQLPSALGGVLPAPVTAQGTAAAEVLFVVSATNITLTTDATDTGAITWVLSWAPLSPGATVTAV